MATKKTYSKTAVNFGTGAFEGGLGTSDVYHASTALAGLKKGQKGAICVICGDAFRVGATRTFRGKVYGVPCGDSEDIASILAQEAAKRYTPKRRGTEANSDLIMEG